MYGGRAAEIPAAAEASKCNKKHGLAFPGARDRSSTLGDDKSAKLRGRSSTRTWKKLRICKRLDGGKCRAGQTPGRAPESHEARRTITGVGHYAPV